MDSKPEFDPFEDLSFGDQYDGYYAQEHIPLMAGRIGELGHQFESLQQMQEQQTVVTNSLLEKSLVHDALMMQFQTNLNAQVGELQRISTESVDAIRTEMYKLSAENLQQILILNETVENNYQSTLDMHERCARNQRNANVELNKIRKQISQLEAKILPGSQTVASGSRFSKASTSQGNTTGRTRPSSSPAGRATCPHCHKELSKTYVRTHIKKFCPRLRSNERNLNQNSAFGL